MTRACANVSQEWVVTNCSGLTGVAEQLHCSLHVKELKVTTTELERQVGN